MGLITGIASSPYKGVMFVLEQIRKSVDRELYDETIWQQKLLDLQMRYDLGEVDQATYDAQEQLIMDQLDLINSLWFGDTEEEEDEDEAFNTSESSYNNFNALWPGDTEEEEGEDEVYDTGEFIHYN